MASYVKSPFRSSSNQLKLIGRPPSPLARLMSSITWLTKHYPYVLGNRQSKQMTISLIYALGLWELLISLFTHIVKTEEANNEVFTLFHIVMNTSQRFWFINSTNTFYRANMSMHRNLNWWFKNSLWDFFKYQKLVKKRFTKLWLNVGPFLYCKSKWSKFSAILQSCGAVYCINWLSYSKENGATKSWYCTA